MPPAIPNRPGTAAYHYHAYDYGGSAPFAAAAVPAHGQFYSLAQDMAALFANGQHLPNIAMGPVPGGAQTDGFRDSLMLSFGNLANAPACPTVVITGGIHAREWIASEFAYLLAEYLIHNYPAAPSPNPRVMALKNLVDNRNIHIIPMVNPDGNIRTIYGLGGNDRQWRKNTRPLPANRFAWVTELAPLGPVTMPFRNVAAGPPLASYEVPDFDPANNIPPNWGAANFRVRALANNQTGVDGNRNMATLGWGYDPPPFGDWNPAVETYFGAAAGGERETSNVQVAMATAAAGGVGGNITVSIDYHSYGRMILLPDEMPIGAPDVDYQLTGRLLGALIRDIGNNGYQFGGGGIGYVSTGTVDSYSAQTHQARAFTIELDPTGVPDPGPAGFVLPDNQIQAVFETNIRGALAAIAAPTGLAAVQAAYGRFWPWAVHGAGNQVP
jgi:hypothetical protein